MILFYMITSFNKLKFVFPVSNRLEYLQYIIMLILFSKPMFYTVQITAAVVCVQKYYWNRCRHVYSITLYFYIEKMAPRILYAQQGDPAEPSI